MRVLVVGDGGREHAVAWACAQHGHTVTLVPAHLPVDEIAERAHDADLVIPGPEAVLAAGIADRCADRGIACFGPAAALARLETSKGWARDLATGLGVPGPRYVRVDHDDAAERVRLALEWLERAHHDVVVKLDGLAGGKGVIVPEDRAATVDAIHDLAARGPIVLEERLAGPEYSLLALCDGTTARALPLAQDHKRIGEGDTGPNTGGMGAYAPAPVPHDPDELVAAFVQPVLDHLRDQGTPYVGVLYAGLMDTAQGPRLIEYNCRFGDPEAQAVLPLLASDLAALALACTEGTLADTEVVVRPGAAVTVVAAAAGYPTSPTTGHDVQVRPTDDDDGGGDALVFPAGVTTADDAAPCGALDLTTAGPVGRTSGGRVLAVTGLGADLAAARGAAYRTMGRIHFDGMQVRRDIAWRAPGATLGSYAAAGVDIDEGTRAVDAMRAAVERTHGPAVVSGVGSFGGVFSLAGLRDLDDPVLVASTDGVGTKVELAARLARVRGVGHDIVNHCIDDVLVQGARPLFFLDYVAASRLDADMVAEIVTGMAEACEAAGCALLGGETAEMPGVYAPGAFDIAGTLVGVADRSALLPRADVTAGDVLIGIGSSGPHTNGYSFLRRLFEWAPMDMVPAGWDRTLGEALLEPHRSYLDLLGAALASGRVKALAHITGGGLPENLPRALPAGLGARIHLDSWDVPPLFELVRELATAMPVEELYRTLNMGIGMVIVVGASDVDHLRATIDEPTWVIGELEPNDTAHRVRLIDDTATVAP